MDTISKNEKKPNMGLLRPNTQSQKEVARPQYGSQSNANNGFKMSAQRQTVPTRRMPVRR